MSEPLRVAYVTTYDAADVFPYSGIGYHVAGALRGEGIEMEYIGPLNEAFGLYYKARQYLFAKVLQKGFPRDREPSILKHYARQIEARLKNSSAQIVFSPGGVAITRLRCEQPIVIWADTTFDQLIDYYWPRAAYSATFLRQGSAQEREALERATVAIFSSDWAAQFAIRFYQLKPEKVKVVPYGANVDCRHTPADIERMVDARPRDVCRLLLLGVDWKRKGCDEAIEVARKLNESGLKTHLTIAGCKAPGAVPEFCTVAGFISKKTPEGRDRINRLLAESHFFLLPTRAECAAIVFCEASAFGLPSIAPKIGGISTVVTDGVNGQTFPVHSFITDACSHIHDIFNNQNAYRDLALSSFNEYTKRLNWKVAGERVKAILDKVAG